ncbi:hypothetical protein NIES4074_56470 [Cylindrospermum sp. NIES-4074]|nr:hypothetical protein NIES4074_56470 [Cylindrospermum sp. NIES-4074]
MTNQKTEAQNRKQSIIIIVAMILAGIVGWHYYFVPEETVGECQDLVVGKMAKREGRRAVSRKDFERYYN